MLPESLSILFIEDDPQYAALVVKLLERLSGRGCEVVHVATMKNGLEMLSTGVWDLVLLDLNLPDSLGLDSLVRLRERDQRVPVVVLSGLPEGDMALPVLQAGAQDFLAKDSLDKAVLWRSLSLAAQRRQAQAELERQVALRTAELSEALQALEQSRAHLQALYQHIPFPILEWRAEDGEFLLAGFNRAALDLSWGLEEDSLGIRASSFFKQYPQLLTHLRRCMANKGIHTHEATYRTEPGGRERFLLLSFAFSPPDRVLIHVQDLTERRNAERAALYLANIVESSEDAIISMDAGDRITSWNRGATTLFGYHAQEALGRNFWFTVPPDLREESRDLLDRLSRRQAPQRLESRFLRRDGSLVDVSLTVSYLRDGRGRQTGRSVIMRDITQRKLAQRELERMEQFQRSILEGINTGVWVSDAQDRITFFNRAMEDISGLTRQQALGIHVVTGFPAATLHFFKPLFKKARSTGNPVPYEAIPVTTPVGRETFQSGWIIPIFRSEGYAGMICTVEDVTARRKAENELLAHQQRLRRLATELTMAEERLRRRVAADLHDGVGQLLAMCKLQLKMAVAGRPELAPGMQGALGMLDRAIDQTRSLTTDLSPPVLYELGLGPALEQLAERHQRLYQVPVVFDMVDRDVGLSPEAAAFLYRAAAELLHNSAKHAKASSLGVRLKRREGMVCLTLTDDGVGFAADEVAEHRTAGMGLFSIRERIQAMGGSLILRSRPGVGTTATLVVPEEAGIRDGGL